MGSSRKYKQGFKLWANLLTTQRKDSSDVHVSD